MNRMVSMRPVSGSWSGAGHEVEGDLAELPPSVSSTGYRVVQEALGNAIRHGDGVVQVRLAHTCSGMHIDVSNPVAPTAGPTPTGTNGDGQWGLIGMRERVRAMGGRVQAEERDGQFHLDVQLPVTDISRTT